MKILCVCDHGNKRSVFTRHLLAYDYDVLSVGVANNSMDTLKLLCDWADKILLAEPQMILKLPDYPDVHKKVDTRFTIGPDIYPVSVGGPLRKIVQKKLIALGYLK